MVTCCLTFFLFLGVVVDDLASLAFSQSSCLVFAWIPFSAAAFVLPPRPDETKVVLFFLDSLR